LLSLSGIITNESGGSCAKKRKVLAGLGAGKKAEKPPFPLEQGKTWVKIASFPSALLF
jgi:hypothetical protein